MTDNIIKLAALQEIGELPPAAEESIALASSPRDMPTNCATSLHADDGCITMARAGCRTTPCMHSDTARGLSVAKLPSMREAGEQRRIRSNRSRCRAGSRRQTAAYATATQWDLMTGC